MTKLRHCQDVIAIKATRIRHARVCPFQRCERRHIRRANGSIATSRVDPTDLSAEEVGISAVRKQAIKTNSRIISLRKIRTTALANTGNGLFILLR